MEENNLISIIIPNYNGSESLSRCLDSVIRQSEKRVEIIIVDDGSKDRSKEIIEDYRSRYSNIKAVYKVNGGVSSARNEGIRHATGTYTLFLDSDDELEENALSVLLENVKDNDILVFSYNLYYPEKDVSVARRQMETEVDGNLLRKNLFYYTSRTHFYACWNKLIRTKMLKDNNILFPEGIKVGEDYIFSLRMAAKAGKVKFANLYLYKYYENCQSVTHKLDMNRWKEQALTIKETYQLHPDRNEYESEFVLKRLYNTYATFASELSKKQVTRILEKYWNEAYGDMDMRNMKGSFRYRLPICFARNKKYTLLYYYLWCIDRAIHLKHGVH